MIAGLLTRFNGPAARDSRLRPTRSQQGVHRGLPPPRWHADSGPPGSSSDCASPRAAMRPGRRARAGPPPRPGWRPPARSGWRRRTDDAPDHLVDQHAERPDVGARVGAPAAQQLRRHVRHGAGADGRLAREVVSRLVASRPSASARPGRNRAASRASGAIITFELLRSRCTMPWLCACATASTICTASCSASSSGSPCPAGINDESGAPRRAP